MHQRGHSSCHDQPQFGLAAYLGASRGDRSSAATRRGRLEEKCLSAQMGDWVGIRLWLGKGASRTRSSTPGRARADRRRIAPCIRALAASADPFAESFAPERSPAPEAISFPWSIIARAQWEGLSVGECGHDFSPAIAIAGSPRCGPRDGAALSAAEGIPSFSAA